jgi:PKD repeat protein
VSSSDLHPSAPGFLHRDDPKVGRERFAQESGNMAYRLRSLALLVVALLPGGIGSAAGRPLATSAARPGSHAAPVARHVVSGAAVPSASVSPSVAAADHAAPGLPGTGVPAGHLRVAPRLAATHDGAAVTVLPATLNFGSVLLGQSRALNLLVGNVGTSTLHVINMVSSSNDVTLSNTGLTLAPGSEGIVSVVFQPTQLGPFAETLDLQTNDAARPLVQVSLRALVVGREPAIEIAPSSLSFGQLQLGQTADFPVTVRNLGVADLAVSNIISNNVQVVASPTAFSVPPQGSRVVSIRCRPQMGLPLEGTVTVYCSDPRQPTVGLSWTATLQRPQYLQLLRVTPADSAFSVPTSTQLELVFDVPIYYRRDYTALDIAVLPEPLSGPVLEDLQVRGDGRTVVIPVTLAPATAYRVVVYGATSQSGLELYQMTATTFSTGSARAAVSRLAGQVAPVDGQRVSGSVYLYDADRRLAGQATVALDGSFALAGVQAGTYSLFLDGDLDERQATGSYDANGDGTADTLLVPVGGDRVGLVITPTIRGGTPPVVASGPVAADLDSAAGNQGVVALTGVIGGRAVVLEVYANAAQSWAGCSVGVAFDSTQVSFAGAEAGDHLLRRQGGTALFITRVDPAAATVEFGGAIMAPATNTVVSGAGLLGRFRFRALDSFAGETALRVVSIKVRTLTGQTSVTPSGVQAVLRRGGVVAPLSVAFTASPANGTVPLTVRFSNTTTGADGRYRWAFGDGDSSSAASPSHFYTTPGVYTVRLTATSGTITQSATQQVTVSPAAPRLLVRALVGNRRLVSPQTVEVGSTLRFEVGTFTRLDTSDLRVVTDYSWLVPARLGQAAALGRLTATPVAGVSDSIAFQRQGLRAGFRLTTLPGAVAQLAITPASLTIGPGQRRRFTAQAADRFGNAVPGLTLNWYAVGGIGTISTTTGWFTAGNTPAQGYIIAAVFVNGTAVFGDNGAKVSGSGRVVVDDGVPAGFILHANAPNPFNAATEISFELPVAAPVRLAVYNLAGQQVAQLVDRPLDAGLHRVRWQPAGQPTGAYLYRLEAGPLRRQGKMLLLR